MLKIIEESIELRVPAWLAYSEWTHFERFPDIMAGIKEVRLFDDAHMHWRAQVAGMEEEWDAEITEKVPGRRVAWRNTTGAANSGVVTFDDIGDQASRLMLRMRYEPHGVTELVGDSLGFVRRRVASDLKRFKHYIEDQDASAGVADGRIPEADLLVGQ